MQLPQWLARFNRHVTNRFWRLCAGWIPAHGILEHVGRRSGKPYRTPLMVFSAEVNGQPGLAIMLTYGPDRDWLKNLTAVGNGRMQRYGQDNRRRRSTGGQQGRSGAARHQGVAADHRQGAVRAGSAA
jgi:deazaflavin-dependent oxidoreductase (nitroreductase family)